MGDGWGGRARAEGIGKAPLAGLRVCPWAVGLCLMVP